ncbi:MAG: bifunctional diaminohydroxyphosphoribosylaminopyrimidine deaminase/5-amino-6-(5-phosphoribosylamino)uracil reductase RibD [Campylobacterales bacterium]|nr:bifunctional diaminohydroxyphosphoribosylaminopyrimidine deaminase/5-amino-6-(5-phosphoribosylamino)uracil reductase RibD [Campylobacterales bacterium]
MNDSKFFMQKAINEAWKYQLLTYPNPAVGALIVKDETILAIGAHHEAGKPHAEVNACKEAYLKYFPDSPLVDLEDSFEIHNFLYQNHNDFFHDCSIYVTLEPCNHTGRTPACAQLLETLRFKEVFIGTLDPNKTASGGYERLQKCSKVYINILKKECDDLLLPFRIWQKEPFLFFKLACRLDGSIDGGYITTQDSLKLVHQLRTKIDLLAIGGNTVRTDRPTLDSRFAHGKNPDVCILSNQKEFDQTIPLFSVPNRIVKISNQFTTLKQNHFVMIEGGYTLFQNLQEHINMIVLFISCVTVQNPTTIEFENFKKIHSYMINDTDQIVFFKQKKS